MSDRAGEEVLHALFSLPHTLPWEDCDHPVTSESQSQQQRFGVPRQGGIGGRPQSELIATDM